MTFIEGDFELGDPVSLENGVASFDTSLLPAGEHFIHAIYSGDDIFDGSTAEAISQQVNQAATATALESSANPSDFGDLVTFTATVTATAPGAGTPTGTVTFYDDATQLGDPVYLDGSGEAEFATSTLDVGNHPITAVYNSDTNFLTSTSNEVTQTVEEPVPDIDTTTTLASDINPSKLDQTVTFTATITFDGDGRRPAR